MTYPPSGQPWQPGQPHPNQPQYGGHSGSPGPDPYGPGPYGPPQGQPYGGDPQHGQAPYPQESYTTEPPMSGQPYSQPYTGEQHYDPNYGAPQPGYNPGYGAPQGYQQPGYQQPGYQQPGYQQAYAPVQQPPSFVAPAAPRGTNGGMIALIAGGVLVLLLVLGVGGALLFRSGDEQPTVTASEGATASPTAGSTGTPSPTPDSDAEYPARIDLPQTVAGLTKVDNPDLNKTANDTALQIKNATNADSAVAAYYAPSGDLTRAVALVGATGRISNPQSELDDAFSGELTVSGIQTVDAGPLGGYMKCGNTVNSGQTLSVCGWADGGSLMLGIFANRSLTDSTTLFRQIRGEILKRG